jgi:D-alanyl-D-alanine dipeptidase
MNNKILTRRLKIQVFTALFLVIQGGIRAQNLPLSAYGLPYINQVYLYVRSLIGHPEKQMVSLNRIPGIVLDLRYAGPHNFLHKNLYGGHIKTSFLRKRVFQALDSVSRQLAKKGFVLVIFDAYRPYSVTEEMWAHVKDDRYAANPANGSGHNRGIAVDLTLADAKTHQLLPMPTGFDNFSDTAHQDFVEVDAEKSANRALLKQTMEEYGFVPLSTEWWHFSWPDPSHWEVLDLNFQELEGLEP